MTGFSLVEFPYERTVDVVPTSLIDKDGCWWPPVDQRHCLQYENAVPDKRSWKKHKARVIKAYDTYKEAIRKMKKGKYTLSFDTSASGCESADNLRSNIVVDSEEETPDLPEIQLPSYGILGTSNDSELEFDSQMPVVNTDYFSRLEKFEKKFARFSEVMLKKMEKLADDVKEIKEHINAAVCASQNAPELNADILDIPVLPIASIDALLEMQEWLKNKENMQIMVTFLVKKGGINYKMMTRKLLQCCMTNGVACLLNWTGKCQKIAFEDHMMVKAIVSAVQLAHNSTEAEIETVVKNWLRFAKDRDGGRDLRRVKKLL